MPSKGRVLITGSSNAAYLSFNFVQRQLLYKQNTCHEIYHVARGEEGWNPPGLHNIIWIVGREAVLAMHDLNY